MHMYITSVKPNALMIPDKKGIVDILRKINDTCTKDMQKNFFFYKNKFSIHHHTCTYKPTVKK